MRAINMMISQYNFRKGDASRIKYIVIHYTGGLGSAKDNCRYFAGGDRKASAHYFVGYEGEIWQSVEDENIAWHCGAKSYCHPLCRNANSIGIEMCAHKKDQSSIRAEDRDWYFEDATVEAAVELTGYLMEKYHVPAANVLRHYDVTGKMCPAPYVHDQCLWEEFQKAIEKKPDYKWTELIRQLLSVIGKFPAGLGNRKREPQTEDRTPIMGKPEVSAGQIAAYIISKNPAAADDARALAELYISEGTYEGVRGDIAAAQAMVETGDLTFRSSMVSREQNNFCGLGATSGAKQACSFKTMQDGVRAHIQHLKAYAGKEPLVNGCVDPRYSYVVKACAPYVEWLGQKENPTGHGWASGAAYGGKILRILEEMKRQKA